MRLADELKSAGIWSPYLEVGIGTHPEIFTMAPVLASVGVGDQVGIRSDSAWNNPEPEIVLVVAPDGRVVGAAVGKDVNLRDFEGRSALLLGGAKDNTASCAVGPWIRLFDGDCTLGELMQEVVSCRVTGEDGYTIEGVNQLSEISRHPRALIQPATGGHHQYPDGIVLFPVTMYVPGGDRHEPGRGFTHDVGDRLDISCPSIGTLVNWVARCEQVPPWEMGILALMHNPVRSRATGEPVRLSGRPRVGGLTRWGSSSGLTCPRPRPRAIHVDEAGIVLGVAASAALSAGFVRSRRPP